MKLKIIACKVLTRELGLLAANSENVLDITYLRQGLHETPQRLNDILQQEIDKIDSGEDLHSADVRESDFDAICLAYGLCSNAILGLSSQKYRLVVPKAHDCITLLLGSREAYQREFQQHNGGIYWYSRGWMDCCLMPGEVRVTKLKQYYTEKYGEDNADFLMEAEQGWLKEYDTCAFIDWAALNNAACKEETRKCADYLQWKYREIQGSDTLLRDMLEGNWDESRFLILNPKEQIDASYDTNVLRKK